MTLLNENLKLIDVKIFFPKSRTVLHQYGIESLKNEQVRLKEVWNSPK